MDNSISYTQVRQNLKTTLDDVVENNLVIRVKRRNGQDAVIMSNDDYQSISEMLHLFSSKSNVKHLDKSLKELKDGDIVEYDLASL